jgi:phenylalanine-4-hydroxylase
MSSTESAIRRLPRHLRRFVVVQDYGAYTPRDQAVWRHVVGRLAAGLRNVAHSSYLRGLEATGIGLDRIPSLDEMNARLEGLGWQAVAVRGFIPPAVFTELQSLGVLAIAEDIRDHRHVGYTPAPDIIHESAGHAPILADARYAAYLKRAGLAGSRAIADLEDRVVFEAVRNLSVVKEDPGASPLDHRLAEARLAAAWASRTRASESARASRLYWWTAEYGLVEEGGTLKLFGAGLLSSLRESAHCLTPAVAKVPLDLACTERDFDITDLQPQLYVARDFEHLFEVLEAFEATLAWKRGGDYGLLEALRARTVNHLVLPDGQTVTGLVTRLFSGQASLGPTGDGGPLTTRLAVLGGPVMAGRGLDRPWPGEALVLFGCDPLPARGPFDLSAGSLVLSGFRVGDLEAIHLRGTLDGAPLDLPSQALLFQAQGLPSVAGGPADPEAWDRWLGDLHALGEGEAEASARRRKGETLPSDLAALYLEVERLRDRPESAARLAEIRRALENHPEDWLLAAQLDGTPGHPPPPPGARP